MRRSFLAVALLALTAEAMAQPADLRVSPLDKLGWSMGVWPELVRVLQPGAPPLTRGAAGGPLGQSLASAGREDLVPPFARTVCTPLLRDGKPVDPIGYLAELAEKASVTMIGEAHEQPATRHFIGQLAVALRSRGYTAYAAETFNPEIGERGPAMPLFSDGTYSDDPIYGRVIRRLRALDYRLLPYEAVMSAVDRALSFVEMNARREVLQAENLAAQMKRVSGKMLVHPGVGHHAEFARPGQQKLMGAVFIETSGINPLTIELITQEAPGDVPVICDAASYGDRPYDIGIGMPKLQYERGRPRWRRVAGDRFAEIPAALRRAGQIAVYEARPAGERGDSTPMERLLLRPDENLPLLLPPGRYDLSVWTEKDGWSPIVPLEVAAK